MARPPDLPHQILAPNRSAGSNEPFAGIRVGELGSPPPWCAAERFSDELHSWEPAPSLPLARARPNPLIVRIPPSSCPLAQYSHFPSWISTPSVPLPRSLLFSRGSRGSFGRDIDWPANRDTNISGISSSFFLSFFPSLRPSRDDDASPPSTQPHFWLAYASHLRADPPVSPPKWNSIFLARYRLAGGHRPIAWSLLATIFPAGKLRRRYIRCVRSLFPPCLPFLPATTIVPLLPPRDQPHDTNISGISSSFFLSSPLPFDHPAMVTCPLPPPSRTPDLPTPRVCGPIRHDSRHHHLFPSGGSLPSCVISPPVSIYPTYHSGTDKSDPAVDRPVGRSSRSFPLPKPSSPSLRPLSWQ